MPSNAIKCHQMPSNVINIAALHGVGVLSNVVVSCGKIQNDNADVQWRIKKSKPKGKHEANQPGLFVEKLSGRDFSDVRPSVFTV
ncbi:hypothetical protein QTP88_020424 [Uroleucon formosanum]